MEWVCNIPVGKSHMRIEFTGGVLTSYGNTPAKYVTKDLLQQTIIEHSDFFKKKRIVLLSIVETDEDEDKLPKHAQAAEHPVNSSEDDEEDDEKMMRKIMRKMMTLNHLRQTKTKTSIHLSQTKAKTLKQLRKSPAMTMIPNNAPPTANSLLRSRALMMPRPISMRSLV